mmetsp:Transcript_15697/g.28189  ORF Transcript_15697/g.28189 Transcript_15697/m.28189 type:complete len:110 (+) Transcript_15697:241-570(+)
MPSLCRSWILFLIRTREERGRIRAMGQKQRTVNRPKLSKLPWTIRLSHHTFSGSSRSLTSAKSMAGHTHPKKTVSSSEAIENIPKPQGRRAEAATAPPAASGSRSHALR